MNTIAEFTATANIPNLVAQCVSIGVNGSADQIRNDLPGRIEAVLFAAERCRTAAINAEEGFKRMSGLAQELVLACTHKVRASFSIKGGYGCILTNELDRRR
jgi:hypothetical protein